MRKFCLNEIVKPIVSEWQGKVLNPGLLHCRRILHYLSHQVTIKIHSKVSLKHLLCALDCSRPRVPAFGGR